MANLATRVYGTVRDVIVKGVNEISYLTGIGWKYEPGDLRNFQSRQDQRRDERIESKKLYLKSLDV